MLTPDEQELLVRTGPGTAMGDLFRRYWLPVLLTEELPAPDCPPVRLRVLGEPLVAFRDTSGRIGVLGAYCAHRRMDLFYARSEEGGLRCVYHGWKYDVAGACLDIPGEPKDSRLKDDVPQAWYPVREAGGVVWVYMGPPNETPELPGLEWLRVPDTHRYLSRWEQDNNYLQGLETEVDAVHLGFLHSLINPVLKPGERLDYRFSDRRPRMSTKDTDYGVVVAARRDAEAGMYYWRLNQFLMPCYILNPIAPGNPMNCQMAVPVDDEHMMWLVATWDPEKPLTEQHVADMSNGDAGGRLVIDLNTRKPLATAANGYLFDRTLQNTSFSGIPNTRVQDACAQEVVGPITDRTKEYLGASDAGIIAMRRRLMNAARVLQQGIGPPEAARGAVYSIRAVAMVLPPDVGFDEDPASNAAMVARA